jgi:S-(hydroxymethyl)glutathione dehydrogenase/alcohol dehydrogenase
MRAAVMWEAGKPFETEEVDIASPGPGQVSVELHASGVCASDLSLTTRFGQPVPVVLGHEGAGIVTEVGPGVTGIAPGQHVVVAWVPPCGHCKPCRRGDDYLCANRRSSADARAGRGTETVSPLAIGSASIHQGMATATFAEHTVVPANAVVPIDEDVPFPVAAMMGCAVPTGAGAALRSARVQPGDAVAVIGCGAVGLNAVMGAVVAGAASLIAVDPMSSRREKALELGATRAVAPEGLEELSDLDVVIDAVGSPATVQSAWRATRRGGTITVVGAGRPDQFVKINAYELFHDDKRLTGSFHGGISMQRDLPVLVALWRSGRLPVEKLIDGVVDLSQINDVVEAQQAGDVVRTILSTHPSEVGNA